MSERLQKFLARAGVASRRHAEGLITAGRVTVNNQRVTELGTKVEPTDLVTVDGTLVTAPERTSWYLLHKPTGVVTTLSDPEGRPTVAGLLAGVEQRVFPVGRLDWDAEGALLVTNDGEAAHRLLHPSFEVPRTYLAKVKGTPTDETLARLRAGVRLEDGDARAIRADRFEVTEKNTWLVLQVGEGRPHLVKRLCAAVGHPVVRLFRPAQAGISVAGLQPGELRPLTAEEVERVQAVAAGKDVDAPTLFLPPRRHGRAGGGEDEEAESEGRPDGAGEARAPTKGPRRGSRGGQRRPPERPAIPRWWRLLLGAGAGRGRPGWGAAGTRGERRRAAGSGAAASGLLAAATVRAGLGQGRALRGAARPGEGGRGPRSGPARSRNGFAAATGDARRGVRSGPPRSRESFGGPSDNRERGPRSGPPRSAERSGSAPGERGRGSRSGPPRSRGSFGGAPGGLGARGPRTFSPRSRDGFRRRTRGRASGSFSVARRILGRVRWQRARTSIRSSAVPGRVRRCTARRGSGPPVGSSAVPRRVQPAHRATRVEDPGRVPHGRRRDMAADPARTCGDPAQVLLARAGASAARGQDGPEGRGGRWVRTGQPSDDQAPSGNPDGSAHREPRERGPGAGSGWTTGSRRSASGRIGRNRPTLARRAEGSSGRASPRGVTGPELRGAGWGTGRPRPFRHASARRRQPSARAGRAGWRWEGRQAPQVR